MDDYLRRLRKAYREGKPNSGDAYIAALERLFTQLDSQYEIQRTLVISTSHISQEDSQYLNDLVLQDRPGIVWINYPYGWILFVDLDEKRISELPPNIRNLLQLAAQENCEWLRLDQDGLIYEGLPTWDW